MGLGGYRCFRRLSLWTGGSGSATRYALNQCVSNRLWMRPNNMFDFEQAIAEWRRKMTAAGIKTPVPLEELESHLREEIDRQIRAGLTHEQAFALAVERIDQGTQLRQEFGKVEDTVKRRRKELFF